MEQNGQISVSLNSDTENDEEYGALSLDTTLTDLLSEAKSLTKGGPIKSANPVKQAVAKAIRAKFERQGFGE